MRSLLTLAAWGVLFAQVAVVAVSWHHCGSEWRFAGLAAPLVVGLLLLLRLAAQLGSPGGAWRPSSLGILFAGLALPLSVGLALVVWLHGFSCVSFVD